MLRHLKLYLFLIISKKYPIPNNTQGRMEIDIFGSYFGISLF